MGVFFLANTFSNLFCVLGQTDKKINKEMENVVL